VIEQGDDRPIVVIGAGGHAKVVIDCLRLSGWNVVGCTDADPTPRNCAGAPVIGSDDVLEALKPQGVSHAFCALGANRLRQRIGQQLIGLGFELPSVAGPGSWLSPSAVIGQGVAVLPGAIINVETVVGDLAIVNTNANVDHDCVLGRASHIGPGCALAGEVHVGDRTFVATGSVVIPRRRIGEDSVVGAGSVVVSDLPAGVIAYGNPARVKRQI
jgi:UDP-perosamine 4-acetyltransferase